MEYPKKLIEVALPLDEINREAAKEKSIRRGHPSSIHLWWARRPLAAARAVLFAQLVNDPGGKRGYGAKKGQTKEDAQKERERLFDIIRELVKWENINNKAVLQQAQNEIWKSWRETCELNKDTSEKAKLFDSNKLPKFHDPFAGGGSIPLEAIRLGLESHASDLNPISVIINKSMIEIPPKVANHFPVGPLSGTNDVSLLSDNFTNLEGLSEDIIRYGKWMKDEAFKRVGHLYPQIEITEELAEGRRDLKTFIGKKLKVITWIWVRTIKSSNPAFSKIEVPLTGSFSLCKKKNKEVWIEPVISSDKKTYNFVVRMGGKPKINGTVNRNGGTCLFSGAAIPFEYIRNEASNGRMGTKLMAIVAEHQNNKIYINPTKVHENIIADIKDITSPEGGIPKQALGIRVQLYGINKYSDLFNPRQKETLQVLTQLINEIDQVPCSKENLSKDYISAIKTYLSFAIGRYSDYGSTMTYWDDRGPSIQKTFGLPTLQMRWSYPETNPFEDFSGNFYGMVEGVARALESLPARGIGYAYQEDAAKCSPSNEFIVSTDPPYYDNIGYAALSDYFYVWIKKALQFTYPELFGTILTPKAEEIIAEPGRHESKDDAMKYFEERFAEFSKHLLKHVHPAFPCTIYYAFKQSNTASEDGAVASTGWEVFLSGLIRGGWEITGTWPLRTEQTGGLRLVGRNALASSILLVCRKRDKDAKSISRRDFMQQLNNLLPEALEDMVGGKEGTSPIAPVDLAQAAIGPGMSIFSKYEAILEADGSHMSIHNALSLINKAIDEYFTEAEGEMDVDTRFCVDWFQQYGFKDGIFGEADVLARAKGTSVEGVQEAGVILAKANKVRLFKVSEYPEEWDPKTDKRTPIWEACHHMCRALQISESNAGELLARMSDKAEPIRQLAYRLYTVCERKGWAEDAGLYNALIASWHSILEESHKSEKHINKRDLFDE
jgi:putative DNA methylase